MKNKALKLNIIGEILPKITDKMENAGYNDRDIMAIRAIACYEGVNSNDALLERDDLEKAVQTLIGKPVRILFDGANPTGHGYNKETKTFSKLVANIGFIQWAYGEVNEQTGRYEVIVEICVWQKYYPKISHRMRELHRLGELNFSIEAERDFETNHEGYRRCFNINFTGIAVVQCPAFQEAKSLMVADLKQQGGLKMENLQEILKNIKENVGAEIAEQFNNHLGLLNAKITEFEDNLKKAKNELTTAKEEIAEKDGVIKSLTADRDKYKDIVETAERQKLGQERLEKLQKYGKVEKTANELAELEKETFVDLLEKMVINYNPSEVAEQDGVGVHFENPSKKKVDNKTKLLNFLEGLV